MNSRNPKRTGIWQRFVTWQDRLGARVEVGGLNDRILRDIGLSRGERELPHAGVLLPSLDFIPASHWPDNGLGVYSL